MTIECPRCKSKGIKKNIELLFEWQKWNNAFMVSFYCECLGYRITLESGSVRKSQLECVEVNCDHCFHHFMVWMERNVNFRNQADVRSIICPKCKLPAIMLIGK